MSATPLPLGHQHLDGTRRALDSLGHDVGRLESWARHLAGVLQRGGCLLAAGNGGSAAQAQHLAAELVGRYRDDRKPLRALALHADTSCLTAICNDYGAEEMYARQVAAHGGAGDVLVALSTSGRSPNVRAAVEAANRHAITTWALTGAAPNPVAARSDDALCIDAPSTAAVQEAHLVAIHMLCAAVDVALGVCQTAEPLPSLRL